VVGSFSGRIAWTAMVGFSDDAALFYTDRVTFRCHLVFSEGVNDSFEGSLFVIVGNDNQIIDSVLEMTDPLHIFQNNPCPGVTSSRIVAGNSQLDNAFFRIQGYGEEVCQHEHEGDE
jgi:hypothetical protein